MTKKLRVGIVGSRDFPRLDLVRNYIKTLAVRTQEITVVSGGAHGVDGCAAYEATRAKIPVVEHLPKWEKHGRSAGFKRNSEIVADIDCLVAFWDGKSRGTLDTINKARATGMRVKVWYPKELS